MHHLDDGMNDMDDEDMDYSGRREIEVREQDRYLPIANIARIMKKVLPNNAKIAKEAKESIQECVSEFISFITSEASDKCQQEKRKTINGDDLLWAMSTLGFDKYVEPLKIYLGKYRESVRGDRPDKKTGNRKDLIPSASFMTSPTMAHFPYEHPSGMTFLSDHTVPMIAPGKGEAGHGASAAGNRGQAGGLA